MKKEKIQHKRYVPKYFKAYELVPEEIYRRFGSLSFKYIDDSLLILLDNIRDHFNTRVFVNNWAWGGRGSYRCFNPPIINIDSRSPQKCKTVNFNIEGVEPEDVVKIILDNKDSESFKNIQHIENKLSYVCIEVAEIKETKQLNKRRKDG